MIKKILDLISNFLKKKNIPKGMHIHPGRINYNKNTVRIVPINPDGISYTFKKDKDGLQRAIFKPHRLELVLDRVFYTAESTIGELSIDGKFECFILEDYDRLKERRKKVHGKTAIPKGTYEIRLTYSPKFKRILPILISVPGFSGIRIHAGNTAKDTEGCLLPGATRYEDAIGQSKRAFNKLYRKLERSKQAGKRITIKVTY